MKIETFDLLRCPNCGGEVTLHIYKKQNDEIVEGLVECSSCNNSFTISNGVLRAIVQELGLSVEQDS